MCVCVCVSVCLSVSVSVCLYLSVSVEFSCQCFGSFKVMQHMQLRVMGVKTKALPSASF